MSRKFSGKPEATPELTAILAEANQCRKAKDWPKCIELYEAALEGNPENIGVLAQLGGAYLKARRKGQALGTLRKAVLLDPNSSKSALRLARNAPQVDRDCISDVMLFVKGLGFQPGTIIDVGVNTGTPGLCEHFPDAHMLLVDPVPENEIFMKAIDLQFAHVNYIVAAAGAEEGQATLSVSPDIGGSRLADTVGRHKHGSDLRVEVKRLDALVDEFGLPGPYVIKADTAGAELDVLRGAAKILNQTELLILETRVRPIAGASRFLETLIELKEMGFMAYDFIDRNYNDADFTLKQFDMIAVREVGYFRNGDQYLQTPKRTETAALYKDIVDRKVAKRIALIQQLHDKYPNLQ